MDQTQPGKLKVILSVSVLVLTLIFGAGLFWFLFLAPQAGAELGKLGWYLFSFAAGLTMIVMPCTLPLAFVIVPLSMGKGLTKGLGMALSFGAGVAIMLSSYGALAALAGKAGLNMLGAEVEDIKNWVYFFAGIFAYTFALGEIGLLKFRMPSYTGSAPDFIQKRKDFAKAFLLGLFLGNIGVGCPHPATPLILIEIASSADVFYGWSMFLVHAIGRVVPLLMLALLGVLGVNGLNWLVTRKDKIERANGWAMVFVAGFILTLGLFTHDWWVNSGQHNLLERLTQEHYFNQTINAQLGTQVAHVHGLEEGQGIFGQPLEWGDYFIVFLWLLPIWWWYSRERKRVYNTPALQIKKLEYSIDRLEEERKGLEVALHIPEGDQGARYREIEAQIEGLEKERRAHEEAVKYGVDSGLRDEKEQRFEELLLATRRNWFLTLSVLLIAVFTFFLPYWFKTMSTQGHDDHGSSSAEHDHGATTAAQELSVKNAISAIDKAYGVGGQVVDESKPHTH